MRILYLHGIGSGADSRTPRTLRECMPEAEITAPELPIQPMAAYEYIQNNFADRDFDLVIGTSLGGFYAQTMLMHKKILINPAMYADEDIVKAIGYGKHDFLCSRYDGAKNYIIDDAFIHELAEIRSRIYRNRDAFYSDKLDVNECNNAYALFGEHDTLVGHYDEFCKWYLSEHAYRFAGSHRLEVGEIRDVLVPLIRKVVEAPFSVGFVAGDILED